jgi:hypothetical protein
MVQRGRGPRLAAEAFEDLRVFGDLVRKELQRHKPASMVSSAL